MLPSDPNILVSYINTKLRDDFRNLDELCAVLGTDKTDLTEKLKHAGFKYIPEINQFR